MLYVFKMPAATAQQELPRALFFEDTFLIDLIAIKFAPHLENSSNIEIFLW